MAVAVPAALIELGFLKVTGNFNVPPSLITFLNIFIGVAVIEEILKYLVVKEKVLKSPEFDEPVDAMLYMIISALGFAALENLLIFLSPQVFSLEIEETFILVVFRFVSATFLHALASGTLGFFLALSFFNKKRGGFFLFWGLLTAIALHGLYNFSIIEIDGALKFLIPLIIIVGLAIFVFWGFRKLKQTAST